MIRSFVLLILLWMPSSLLGDIAVKFSPSKEVPAEIIKAIDSAVWTLDIAIYNLDHSGILESIEQASKDGVRVRIILNRPDKELKTAKRLEESGVDVRHVNMTMHHKFAIADSSLLVTGSGNWTNNAFLRYDEDLLTLRNEPAYVSAFVGEFEALWNWSKEFGDSVYEPKKLLRRKPEFGRVVFTSNNMTKKERAEERIFGSNSKLEDGVCGLQLIDGINKAESTIVIATTHFRRGDIAEALRNAIERERIN